jgi:hypothetical protein
MPIPNLKAPGNLRAVRKFATSEKRLMKAFHSRQDFLFRTGINAMPFVEADLASLPRKWGEIGTNANSPR